MPADQNLYSDINEINPKRLTRRQREEIAAEIERVDQLIRKLETHPMAPDPALRGWLPVGPMLRSLSLKTLRRYRNRLARR